MTTFSPSNGRKAREVSQIQKKGEITGFSPQCVNSALEHFPCNSDRVIPYKQSSCHCYPWEYHGHCLDGVSPRPLLALWSSVPSR